MTSRLPVQLSRTLLLIGVAFSLAILAGCKMPAPDSDPAASFSIPTAQPTNTFSIDLPPTPLGSSGPLPFPHNPNATNSLLPSALYLLRPDPNQINQVWRLSPDGAELTQVTFSDTPVSQYDISSDGRLAVITAQSLIVYSPDKTQTETWLNSSPGLPEQNPRASRWAPGGGQLAYAAQGVWIGRSPNTVHLAVADPPGSRIRPFDWSPDGRWLLVTIDSQEQSKLAVLDPATGVIQTLVTSDGIPACCQAAWAPQSQGLVVANPYPATGIPELQTQNGVGGLWWAPVSANQAEIQVSALLPSFAADETYNFVGWPHFNPDTTIQYAFANFPLLPQQRFPLALYKASLATPDLRQMLRAESFLVDQILWSPNGDLALLVLPMPGSAWKSGGPVILVAAGQEPATPLIEQGASLKWGP